jgi:hypothetical protein
VVGCFSAHWLYGFGFLGHPTAYVTIGTDAVAVSVLGQQLGSTRHDGAAEYVREPDRRLRQPLSADGRYGPFATSRYPHGEKYL